MRIVVLRCGKSAHSMSFPGIPEILDLPEIPTRQDLKPIDEIAKQVLPHDPTPSLQDIAMQPDVPHMGAPGPAPQPIEDPLRFVVVGSDAALSAVLTRLMRADHLWAEIGFVPLGASVAATNWGLPSLIDATELARSGTVRPAPLIRDDASIAIAGHATVSDWENREITAEVIVDDHVLLRNESGSRIPALGTFGAKLVPMTDAPGIAAVVLDTPLEERAPKGLDKFLRRKLPHGTADASSLSTGRALQAGGQTLRIAIDGISRKRPVDRVTFYRHLRDLQIVRP